MINTMPAMTATANASTAYTCSLTSQVHTPTNRHTATTMNSTHWIARSDRSKSAAVRASASAGAGQRFPLRRVGPHAGP